MTRYTVRAAALIVPAALAALAGCASQAAQPQAARATVTLSQDIPVPLSPGASPPRILPTRTVGLALGQSVAVRYEYGPAGTQWTQTVPGDSRILGQTTATTYTCSPESVGCGETSTTTYTARAAGTTTVLWSYIFRGSCQNTRKPCPVATQAINVIVHR